MKRKRHTAANAVQIAINGARKLSDADARGHVALIDRAAREFAQGIDCGRHWVSLADTGNMAEALVRANYSERQALREAA